MLDKQVNELENAIVRWHKDSAASQTLAQLPGIGPITASVLVASIGNAKNHYLRNYLGWRRMLERYGKGVNIKACLYEALGHPMQHVIRT